MIQIGTPIILIANNSAQINEAILRLARVGIESVIGYLRHGITTWDQAGLKSVQSSVLSVTELKKLLDAGEKFCVLDVRRPGEYAAGHIPKAVNIPLAELAGDISHIATGLPLAIVCAGGYRSSIATSVLERAGITEITNILGGTSAWKNAGFPMEHKETAMA